MPSFFIAATSRQASSIALGSASVSLGFLACDSQVPVQPDQVDAALGQEPGVVGEVLGTRGRAGREVVTAQKRIGAPSPRTKPFLSERAG